MFDKLLVANDGSQGGGRAFQCALELGKRLGVALDMICVEEGRRHPLGQRIAHDIFHAGRKTSVPVRLSAP